MILQILMVNQLGNPFLETDIWQKIGLIEKLVLAESLSQDVYVPKVLVRPSSILPPSEMPARKGLSEAGGRAHLLHDLANIELQAAELGLRTLIDFPEAPLQFREHLKRIVLEELQHLKLCLFGMESMGFKWGDWPVHLKLWMSTDEKDTLIERVFIVHNYLEGSGLDSSANLLKKLSGVVCRNTHQIIQRIAKDEERHVEFGTCWFKNICHLQKREPDIEFKKLLKDLSPRLPRRVEKIQTQLRRELGFSEFQLMELEKFRISRLDLKAATDPLSIDPV
jgi:uncharacterized ferritin-like protein (DUF455 family)